MTSDLWVYMEFGIRFPISKFELKIIFSSQYGVTIDICCLMNCERKSCIEGRIVRKSPVMSFKTGKSGFLLLLTNSNELSAICFRNDSISTFDRVDTFFSYRFEDLVPCLWSGDRETVNNVPWFLASASIDIPSLITEQDTPIILQKPGYTVYNDDDYCEMGNCFYDFTITPSNNNTSNILESHLILRNSLTEINILIKIGAIHEEGWLDIDSYSLNLYLFHYPDINSLQMARGNTIRCLSVLPVYLWGELKGFACTVRTTIIQIPHFQTQQKSQFSVPALLQGRSYVWCAWWTRTLTKIQYIVQITQRAAAAVVSTIISNSCDKDLCLIGGRSLRTEFTSLLDLEFEIMRGREDLDWISSCLPKVLINIFFAISLSYS